MSHEWSFYRVDRETFYRVKDNIYPKETQDKHVYGHTLFDMRVVVFYHSITKKGWGRKQDEIREFWAALIDARGISTRIAYLKMLADFMEKGYDCYIVKAI